MIRVSGQTGIALFVLTFLVGCSSLQGVPRPKTFQFERAWARHTIGEEYLGHRVRHQMSPVLYENLVIQGNGIDGIRAFDQRTGNLRWEKRIPGGVEIGATLSEGQLYFGANDGTFYSLNAADGRVNWSFPLRAEGLGRPLVAKGVVYFLAGNNSAYALKEKTGEQIWVYSRTDNANLTVRGGAEPTIIGNVVLFGFSDGALVALDALKGNILWERQLGSTGRFRDVDAKPIVDGDRIYVSSYDGQLYCLSAKDGSTIWTFEEGGYSPVTIVHETLYFATTSSAVVALDKASGKMLWRIPVRGGMATRPVYFRNLLLFGEWEGRMRAVDAQTGSDVASYATGRGVAAAFTLDEKNSHAYVISIDADLYAFRLGYNDAGEVWPWEK